MSRAFKRQKVPAIKRRLCFALKSPHKSHRGDDGYERAKDEYNKLSNKFKGSKFDIFWCEKCRGWHVGKLPEPEEEEVED